MQNLEAAELLQSPLRKSEPIRRICGGQYTKNIHLFYKEVKGNLRERLKAETIGKKKKNFLKTVLPYPFKNWHQVFSCGMQTLQLCHVGSSSLSRLEPGSPGCTGSVESQPLDHQGSPSSLPFNKLMVLNCHKILKPQEIQCFCTTPSYSSKNKATCQKILEV